MRSKNEERILNEKINAISMVKVFNLYQQRNEWVSYDGDTSLVNRSNYHVLLTLDEAQDSAEGLRKPGSKFFIAETPAIKVSTKSGFLIITELFSPSPLKGSSNFGSSVVGLNKAEEVLKQLLPCQWFVQDVYDAKSKTTELDDSYYIRRSSPGDMLCWSLSVHALNTSYIQEIFTNLERLTMAVEVV